MQLLACSINNEISLSCVSNTYDSGMYRRYQGWQESLSVFDCYRNSSKIWRNAGQRTLPLAVRSAAGAAPVPAPAPAAPQWLAPAARPAAPGHPHLEGLTNRLTSILVIARLYLG